MLRNYIIKMIMISEVIKKLKQLKIEIKEKKHHNHDSVHCDFGRSFITKESRKKKSEIFKSAHNSSSSQS